VVRPKRTAQATSVGYRSPTMSKTYTLDITGICVEEDEIENTTIHICRNGEWCEIPWDKDDIVQVKESDNER